MTSITNLPCSWWQHWHDWRLRGCRELCVLCCLLGERVRFAPRILCTVLFALVLELHEFTQMKATTVSI